ncbi:MAG: hypothetical protein Q8M02_00810 [Candidatus Didemnitutus sp.]|nr:hypothetical protein [Candidatus Didemnitutus sp.]
MTHFPHQLRRTDAKSPAARTPASDLASDVTWGRPVFRAPQLKLQQPHAPLAFTAKRVTRNTRSRSAARS